MNRRTALKSGLLFTGISALSTLSAMATDAQNLKRENKLKNHKLVLKMNNLEIFLFSDGHVLLEKPQPIFALFTAVKEFDNELKEIHLQKLDLAINVMLVKTNDRLILISGSGKHFGENEGWLFESIEAAGIKADDITDIFITHAHRDHIGGLIAKEGEIACKKAKCYMAKKEYDFWMSASPDFSKSKIKSNRHAISFVFYGNKS